jgi:hypothetical protein
VLQKDNSFNWQFVLMKIGGKFAAKMVVSVYKTGFMLGGL